jgi:uncharacterized protein
MIRVEVVYSPSARQIDCSVCELPPGHTLIQAVRASGVLSRHGLAEAGLRWGIWGRIQPAQTVLRDGDRVEIYRPLQADPKESRRRRQRQQKPLSRRRSL